MTSLFLMMTENLDSIFWCFHAQ